MRKILPKKLRASFVALALLTSIFSAPTAQALYKVIPATQWGNIYAGSTPNATPEKRGATKYLQAKSKIEVKYNNFPDWAKKEVQAAVDVWAANFSSTVTINVDASWGRSSSWGILGSARPTNFYSGFAGAPDPSLWYTSALANALAGKDLDKANPEMIIQVNSSAAWNIRGDGAPGNNEYDLESVFLHEIAHGLGFLSNDSYDSYYGIASLDQPTPYDAYAQTSDGRRLADLPSPSIELGQALTSTLTWSGPLGIKANNGVKPKLYTPSRYIAGSSTSHLDEASFSKTGLDSVMTPNLDPGEIFKEPGPLLLAMMEDMRNKPPAGVALGIPQAPRNVQAFVADSAALISFDPPINIRTAQVTEYVVRNLKTGVEKTALTRPVVISGLKNGLAYSFSVVAKNSMGDSEPAISKSMTPQAGWKSTVLDSVADGKSLSSTTFNGQPAIAYTDSKTGDLKLATFNGKIWKKTTVDGAGGTGGRTSHPISGHISMCVNGIGTKQVLHLFYSDSTDKDLRYSSYNGKSFVFNVVDGDGPSVNEYSDPIRVRTSSDVSVSNACVATAAGVQVFYRDESQGVLLGAVKTKAPGWTYEMIDGDSKIDGHTTGDVGFHLQAIFDGFKTYVAYDSVVTLNQKKEITAGAIRVATRRGSGANTWSYQTLDMAADDASVFGYDVALSKVDRDVLITWLSTSASSFPKPDQIRWALLSKPLEISKITTENFGTPGEFLSTDGKTIVFNCQDRLCALDTTQKDLGQAAIRLIRSTQGSEPTQSTWVIVNKFKYLLATVNGKLALLKP